MDGPWRFSLTVLSLMSSSQMPPFRVKEKSIFFSWQASTNVETPQSLEWIPQKSFPSPFFSVNHHEILNPLYPEDSLNAAVTFLLHK